MPIAAAAALQRAAKRTLAATAPVVTALCLVTSASASAPFTLSTVSPTGGSTVSGTIAWQVSYSGATPSKVTFYVDGVLKGRVTVPPFTYALDTTSLANGTHTLKAIGVLNTFNTSTKVSVTSKNSAPVNTSPPTISGTAVLGQTLVGSVGSWSGSPTSYAYQWQRCDTAGASCVAITGATASTYLIASGDVGATLRLAVKATNGRGSTTAVSTATPVVQAPPTNTALPSISGSAVVGQTLTGSAGSWSGSPSAFAYQWQSCDSTGASCVPVVGATGTSYLVQSADAGTTLRFAVTASNSVGATTAVSSPTAVVQGSASAQPCAGVAVKPGDNVQNAINAYASGTTFCFAPGTYRLANALVLKSNDVLDGGGQQAILDGSKDITSQFVASGSLWVAGGQTQSLTYSGQCESAKPLCQQADDVFFDGAPLKRVGSVAAVTAGTFYFDHTAGNVYIGDNPAGHRVEATVATQAVHGWGTGADGVTIRGLVVQHFAQTGVQCRGNTWTVTASEIRWNHGDGLQDCANVTYSNLHDNGKDGYVFGGSIGSSPGPYTFSYNTVSGNNYAGFDPNWEAGGAKFMQMANLTVSHNTVTGNDGNGLWADTGNQYVVFDSNTIQGNTMSGILYEASYDASITDNLVSSNGTACTGTLCNSGIEMNDSQSVQIYGNTLSGNVNGIGLTQISRSSTSLGPVLTQNDSIHDNTVTHSGRSGLVEWDNDGSYYTSRNNHFTANAYDVCGDATPFIWQNPSNSASYTAIGWTQWQTDGNDLTGSDSCS